MTKNKNEVYKCIVCGNIIEVLHAGGGELVCCNKPMIFQKENTVDASVEKHIPIIEKTENSIKVIVGEIEHPMSNDHHIEWIEILVDGKSYRKFLKVGDIPQVKFHINGKNIIARAYCNLHGLWKNA